VSLRPGPLAVHCPTYRYRPMLPSPACPCPERLQHTSSRTNAQSKLFYSSNDSHNTVTHHFSNHCHEYLMDAVSVMMRSRHTHTHTNTRTYTHTFKSPECMDVWASACLPLHNKGAHTRKWVYTHTVRPHMYAHAHVRWKRKLQLPHTSIHAETYTILDKHACIGWLRLVGSLNF